MDSWHEKDIIPDPIFAAISCVVPHPAACLLSADLDVTSWTSSASRTMESAWISLKELEPRLAML